MRGKAFILLSSSASVNHSLTIDESRCEGRVTYHMSVVWHWKHNCHDNMSAVLQELFRVDVAWDLEGVRTLGREVVAPKVA